MQVGLAQINTIVGDIAGNSERILKAYFQLREAGAELVVCPELVITGYPPRDLLFKSRFVPDNLAALAAIARETDDVPLVLGFVEPNQNGHGRAFLNAAAWCLHGEVQQVARKTLLPTYDVFDEDRYFQEADSATFVEWQGKRIGLTICEDIWTGPLVETGKHYHRDPVAQLAGKDLDLLINISASPWHYGKGSHRRAIVQRVAERCTCTVVYVNAVGGNDELVFDGHSMIMTAGGNVLAALAGFEERCQVVDLKHPTGESPDFMLPVIEEIRRALVLGLRDYMHKSGFRKALIGLSGGIDSAVTAALAVEALGAENVTGVSLPSTISSQHSQDDAAALARNLGITYHHLPIGEVVESAEQALTTIWGPAVPRDVTEENIQARARGLLLMALSNKTGALLLTTGNKSELSVGYCTLYGDMAGGLAVISDLPKTRVFELARWFNHEREVIPENTIIKPPSAELRPDQKDEDSLPPYEILDAILDRYIVRMQSAREIAAVGFDAEVVREVIRKVDLNEYKRKQAAPGLKITPLAFGVGRRIPIVQRYVEGK